MKYMLVFLNVIAAVWLFIFSPAIPLASDSARYRQVLELCRTGVINAPALRSQYPDVASPEGQLASTMSHGDGYFRFFIWPAAALALTNAILIAVFMKSPGERKT